jgi:hypothetical protein
MVLQKDEMTDSEIIELLAEYNFSDKEMSKMLKEIKERDFESVLAFIESVRTSEGKWKEDDKEKMLEEMRKRQDIQKMEEERMNRYKSILKGKIKANREEQIERENKENATIKVTEPEIKVEGDIKIRILYGIEEFYFGFDLNGTVENIYEKVAKKIGETGFELIKFGIGEKVKNSKISILEQFKAKAVMLEAIRSK